VVFRIPSIRGIREIRGQNFFGCPASPRYAFLRPILFGSSSAPLHLCV
jgi:hypothetical protein